MTYRPLPEGVTVKASEIDGLGLFAEAPIEANWGLGVARVFIVSPIDNELMQVRTPLGGFVNHSRTPNCVMARGYTPEIGACVMLVTLRPIEAGEELTAQYRLEEYEDAPWM